MFFNLFKNINHKKTLNNLLGYGNKMNILYLTMISTMILVGFKLLISLFTKLK